MLLTKIDLLLNKTKRATTILLVFLFTLLLSVKIEWSDATPYIQNDGGDCCGPNVVTTYCIECIYAINPKRCGLFGLLDMRGGGLIQSILENRTVTPPNFILEQQTESYMKAEVFT